MFFPDGVSTVIQSPDESCEPPTPNGTAVTVTHQDSSGRPAFTVFLPEIRYPNTKDELAASLGSLALLIRGNPRAQAPGWSLCSICSRFGAWLTASVNGRRWLPLSSTIRTIENNQVHLSFVFILGNLEDMIQTPVHRLVSGVVRLLGPIL